MNTITAFVLSMIFYSCFVFGIGMLTGGNIWATVAAIGLGAMLMLIISRQYSR